MFRQRGERLLAGRASTGGLIGLARSRNTIFGTHPKRWNRLFGNMTSVIVLTNHLDLNEYWFELNVVLILAGARVRHRTKTCILPLPPDLWHLSKAPRRNEAHDRIDRVPPILVFHSFLSTVAQWCEPVLGWLSVPAVGCGLPVPAALFSGGHVCMVCTQAEKPRLFLVKNFLNKFEVDHMISLGKGTEHQALFVACSVRFFIEQPSTDAVVY